MTTHTCTMPRCRKLVPDHLLMCRDHWGKVDPETRRLINQLYSGLANTDSLPDSINLAKRYREVEALAIAQVEAAESGI